MGAAFDYKGLAYSFDRVAYKKSHDILNSEKENESFRRNVCYVSQEDEFESESVFECFINSIEYTVKENKEAYVLNFIKRYLIYKCFGIDPTNTRLDRSSRRVLKQLGLRQQELTLEDIMVAKYLSMSTKRMSGGQKKLTNIFSNLIRYDFCELVILDEPLNNLDYSNVRAFSNVLTRIYRSKSELAIILVTHCRSIPIVNRIIEIDPVQKQFKENETYICSSCFGTVNEEGLYQ
jgi:ABC-type multidrug transport system ATPase subunit